MKYLLSVHVNNGHANAPQCYVYICTACLGGAYQRTLLGVLVLLGGAYQRTVLGGLVLLSTSAVGKNAT
jgi:hypothetical protein